jgi:uncharacterized protein YqfA (UPF0365 family)
MPEAASLLVLVFLGIILFFVFLYFVPINLWITAIFSGVRVGLFELVFMRIRKVPPRIIVESLITATKAGLKLTSNELETHYLAGWKCSERHSGLDIGGQSKYQPKLQASNGN